MKKIVIINGGNSSERDVSLVSATEVYNALTSLGYDCLKIDPSDFDNVEDFLQQLRDEKPYIVFNALHGGDGENGNIQALLEMAEIPFTGSGSLTSKLAMDKYVSKLIAQDLNIPTPKFFLFIKGMRLAEINIQFSLPYIVKPNNGGSSVGITVVKELSHLEDALNSALVYDDRVLIEQFIPGKELTVTILGQQTYPVVEIRPIDGWYDYKNKYTKGNTEYICPAEISEYYSSKVQEMAYNFFERIAGKAYGRIDFRFDGEEFYFLEANTLPGMTSLSLTPMAVKSKGIDFKTLLQRIIDLSF
ncbi:MAG: D-alanine--D-alanine ligase [Candidatus Cloacimonadales bacterium]